MLRIVASSNAAGAIKYFTESLSVGDYYANGQTCQGIWHGNGASLLGLTGDNRSGFVTADDFKSMAHNIHPTKGGSLTDRTLENRRVGYDMNFDAPKSVSLIYGLTGDPRLLEAFRSAVHETMKQMESEMKTRVRVGGANFDRTVGNLCWAEFIHHTARPVGGKPDPHLHAHCYTFNSVWDEVEQKWKAGQFGDLKRDAPFFEACFHSRLSAKVVELGYAIERRGKFWEITNVPQHVIELFSRRTAQINARAEELGITDPERKSGLGAKTRAKKTEGISLDALRKEWASRIDADVLDRVTRAPADYKSTFGRGIERTAQDAIALASSRIFERESVIPERKFLAAAIISALGCVPIAGVINCFEQSKEFIRSVVRDTPHVTTKEVVAEEKRIIAFAREGRGTCKPFSPGHVIKDERLNEQQRDAVTDILNSSDRVMILRGGAGTGKTTLMKEIVEGIIGKPLTVLAPTADASRGVLRSEGYEKADTIAKFLVSTRLQKGAYGGVLWVDEVGLVGTKTLAALLEHARELKARVILSGDHMQHKSVERGSPLRLLTEYADIKASIVTKVVRQRGLYRSAVEHLVKGDTERGFANLHKLGFIREVDETDAHKEIAYNYANTKELGRSSLVISPTHAEGGRVTKAIREELKRRELIKGKSRFFDRLEDLRFTDAEKQKPSMYESGYVVQFHQNVKGFKAGVKYEVMGKPESTVLLSNFRVLPLSKSKYFNVYKLHEKAVELCRGDTIRITANGKSLAHKRLPLAPRRPHALNNGAMYQVAGFTPRGHVRLDNGWILARDYGHFNHGYCVTSLASQGKTVDVVFIAQSMKSSGGVSAEQFYVSVSRARSECCLYTDDINSLKERIKQTHPHIPGIEVAKETIRDFSREKARSTEYEEQRRTERESRGHAR